MALRTRWFWLRHAPARIRKGVFVGKSDPSAALDSSQREIALLAAYIAKFIPTPIPTQTSKSKNAASKNTALPLCLLVTSTLRRARETAEAIINTQPAIYQVLRRIRVAAFNEQNFGVWDGKSYDIEKQRALWNAPATYRPPAGESFADLCHRVARAVERIESALQAMGDKQGSAIGEVLIVVVAHAGTIRAAIAHALALSPEQTLPFAIDILSCTRIDRYKDIDRDKTHSMVHCVNALWG